MYCLKYSESFFCLNMSSKNVSDLNKRWVNTMAQNAYFGAVLSFFLLDLILTDKHFLLAEYSCSHVLIWHCTCSEDVPATQVPSCHGSSLKPSESLGVLFNNFVLCTFCPLYICDEDSALYFFCNTLLIFSDMFRLRYFYKRYQSDGALLVTQHW